MSIYNLPGLRPFIVLCKYPRYCGSDIVTLFQGFCETIPLRLWRHFNGMTAPFQWNDSAISMEQQHCLNGIRAASQWNFICLHCCHLAYTVAYTAKLSVFQRVNLKSDSSVGKKRKKNYDDFLH